MCAKVIGPADKPIISVGMKFKQSQPLIITAMPIVCSMCLQMDCQEE
jgi:hypothetical protein